MSDETKEGLGAGLGEINAAQAAAERERFQELASGISHAVDTLVQENIGQPQEYISAQHREDATFGVSLPLSDPDSHLYLLKSGQLAVTKARAGKEKAYAEDHDTRKRTFIGSAYKSVDGAIMILLTPGPSRSYDVILLSDNDRDLPGISDAWKDALGYIRGERAKKRSSVSAMDEVVTDLGITPGEPTSTDASGTVVPFRRPPARPQR